MLKAQYKPLVVQFIRYGLVGALNTAVGVSGIALGAFLGWHYALYTLFGYGVAFVASFALNLKFTFKAEGATRSRFMMFLYVNLLNLGFVQLMQFMLIEWFAVGEYIAVAVAMVCYTLTGFVMNKKFVFNEKNKNKVVSDV